MSKNIEQYTLQQQILDLTKLVQETAELNAYLTKQNLQHMRDIDQLRKDFNSMVIFQSQILDAIKEHFGRDIKNTLRVVK